MISPFSIQYLVAYLDLERSEPNLAVFPFLNYFDYEAVGFLSHFYDECVVHISKVH